MLPVRSYTATVTTANWSRLAKRLCRDSRSEILDGPGRQSGDDDLLYHQELCL